MNYVEMFINYLGNRKNYSENTLDAYSRDLNDFSEFVSKPLTIVSKHEIIDYLDSQNSKGMSVSTINRRLASIKSFYKYLLSEEIINFSPAETIESGKVDQSIPSTVSMYQFNEIIKIVDNLRDRIIMELFLASGIRRNELAELQRNRVDLHEGVIHVQGKGKKDRIVPLYDDIVKKLSLWLDQHNSPWVFPSPVKKGTHLSTRQINDIVKKWSKRAGYENITPHAFRHSFGTYLYENGADIKAIQEMMGHESVDTTNIYTKTSIKRNKNEYLKCHPLNKRDS